MRVGIYNRWLATLGGGEKLSLAVAEYLSQKNPVDVITHKPVTREEAEARLSLDLSNVNFVTIPDRQSIEVSLLTPEYDFFINTSFMDYFPSFAPYSANLVFFPARLDPRTAWGRQLKLQMRRWLKLPAVLAGFQSFIPEGQDFKWQTDVVVKIRLPSSRKGYRMRFAVRSLDERVRTANVALNGRKISRIDLHDSQQRVRCEVDIPAASQKSCWELTISTHGVEAADGNPKIELSNLWLSLPEFHLYQAFLERWLTGIAIRLQYYPPGASLLDYVDTYNQVWAISEFTRRWIRNYWKRESRVLYSPVNLDDYHVGEKNNWILSVGRFFSGQHNKKHHAMLQAFCSMVDQGLRGWEFHLAGGTTPGEEHAAYLASVYETAIGYPVVIHPDVSFPNLIDLYSQSAVYWHASGFGEDEQRDPVKFEHFGITTIEAMASGCVPVVIGNGGQPEIVAHGVSGYLWQTQTELEQSTWNLVNRSDLRQKMSAAAFQASSKFSKANFHKRLDELLSQIGVMDT